MSTKIIGVAVRGPGLDLLVDLTGYMPIQSLSCDVRLCVCLCLCHFLRGFVTSYYSHLQSLKVQSTNRKKIP